jgi:hypothetical protein
MYMNDISSNDSVESSFEGYELLFDGYIHKPVSI